MGKRIGPHIGKLFGVHVPQIVNLGPYVEAPMEVLGIQRFSLHAIMFNNGDRFFVVGFRIGK